MEFGFLTLHHFISQNLILLTLLLTTVIKNRLDNGKRSAVNDILTKLQQIQNNSIGIIELPNQLDIAQVTEIFICINSKGVVLSQADFATSKISSDDRFGGNQIRKTMDYFCHLMQKPEDFEAIR